VKREQDVICVVIYSYKSSNLLDVVETLYKNTSNTSVLAVTVYDQHQLNRKAKFEDYDLMSYEHVFWDHMYSPITYKKKHSQLNMNEYILFISDDVMLPVDWDVTLKQFINGRDDIVVSGSGKASVSIEGKYFLKNTSSHSDSFSVSNYIDRNLIFSKGKLFHKLEFPTSLKYLGEEEFLSVEVIKNQGTIFSCPSDFYVDLGVRTLENLYCPFSIEHHYNQFVDYVKNPEEDLDPVTAFFSYHNLDPKELKRLVYQIDDVLYDPNTMEIVDVGGERYVDHVKSIF